MLLMFIFLILRRLPRSTLFPYTTLFRSSLVAERDRHYMRILGTRGSGSIQPLAVFKELEHGMLDVTPHVPPGRENMYTASYREELTDFFETARGNRPYSPPVEQVELMKIVAAAYRSAAEQREIEL